jgi:NAD-dependent DNA ligase
LGIFSLCERDEIKAAVEQHGGKNISSISKKTDYVAAGFNTDPSKLQKAEELGVPIISEEDVGGDDWGLGHVLQTRAIRGKDLPSF